MLKKLFALASLTALTGVFASVAASGCTSETTVTETDSGATDSGRTDGGGKKDADPVEEDSGPATCPNPAPAQDPPWKPAADINPVCTQADLTLINTKAQQQGTTFKSLETDLAAQNAACATCVFTKENDAAWGPIVYAGDGSSGGAFFNYGSCFSKAPGGSDDCGKAIQQSEFCLDAVCTEEECGSENALTACIQSSLQDTASCGKYPVQTACGQSLQALSQTCRTGLDVIRVMCSNIAADAGDM